MCLLVGGGGNSLFCLHWHKNTRSERAFIQKMYFEFIWTRFVRKKKTKTNSHTEFSTVTKTIMLLTFMLLLNTLIIKSLNKRVCIIDMTLLHKSSYKTAQICSPLNRLQTKTLFLQSKWFECILCISLSQVTISPQPNNHFIMWWERFISSNSDKEWVVTSEIEIPLNLLYIIWREKNPHIPEERPPLFKDHFFFFFF